MSKVRSSILLSLGQNYFSFGLQFIASVFIARLLTPAEIGVFSIAMILIGFAHTLRDFGTTSYIVQEKELTPAKIQAAFALTLIMAWVLALLIWLASDFAATYYRESGIKSVMLVISLSFLILPFGSIPMAILHRNMDFRPVAIINICAAMVWAVTSIGLAYLGYSYLSMAWGSVAGVVCTILMVQFWRPKDLPLLPSTQGIRKVFSFGMLSNSMMILLEISRGVPELILGRLSEMMIVGYFGRAMGLVSLFEKLVMKSLWSVAFPHFAQQARANEEIKGGFLRSITYVTALAWPFFSCLGLLAYPVVIVLYGEQWEPSVYLVQMLCLAMMMTAPFLLFSPLMMAIGKLKKNVYILLLDVLTRFVCLGLAAPFGLTAIGWAVVVSNLVNTLAYYVLCRMILRITLNEIMQSLYQSIGVTVATCIPSVIIVIMVNGGFVVTSLWLQLIAGLICSVLAWIAGLFLFSHPLSAEVRRSMKFGKSH